MMLDALFIELSKSLGTSPITASFFTALLVGFFAGKISSSPSIDPLSIESKNKLRLIERTLVTQSQSSVKATASSISISSANASVELNKEIFEQLAHMVRMGKKLEAIKFLREKKSTDLKDSKDLVDLLEVHLDKIQNLTQKSS
jgi:ribosomal protein L7/L12